MTPRQECLLLIAKANADFDIYREPPGMLANAWTPAGTIWQATGCHSLTVNYYTDQPAAWRDLLDDLRKGTAPCDQNLCDTCDEETKP